MKTSSAENRKILPTSGVADLERAEGKCRSAATNDTGNEDISTPIEPYPLVYSLNNPIANIAWEHEKSIYEIRINRKITEHTLYKLKFPMQNPIFEKS